jgi:hypothetical protein
LTAEVLLQELHNTDSRKNDTQDTTCHHPRESHILIFLIIIVVCYVLFILFGLSIILTALTYIVRAVADNE